MFGINTFKKKQNDHFLKRSDIQMHNQSKMSTMLLNE